MRKMNALDWVAMILLIVGGLNWGLVGIAKWDLVAAIVGVEFGEVNVVSQIIYVLVGLAALYMLLKSMMPAKPAASPAGQQPPM